jgi:hypothetical protein
VQWWNDLELLCIQRQNSDIRIFFVILIVIIVVISRDSRV